MATNAALDALQAEAEAEAAHGTVEAQHRWPFGPHGDSWDAEHADAAQAPDPRWCAWQARQSEWTAQLPDGLVSIAYDPADPHLEEKLLAAMGRDGAVILKNAVPAELCDQVVADMRPYVEAGSFLGEFCKCLLSFCVFFRTSKNACTDGEKSKRIGSLPARSRASDPIVAHPTLMKLCDALLGRQVMRMDRDDVVALADTSASGAPQQLPWTLDLTQIITLNAGAKQQVLHHGTCSSPLQLSQTV